MQTKKLQDWIIKLGENAISQVKNIWLGLMMPKDRNILLLKSEKLLQVKIYRISLLTHPV